MSRSGYNEGCDNWQLICWRGAVNSALRGKRGQQFLSELLEALDAMEDKALIAHELEYYGEFCALGVIGKARGIEMDSLSTEDEYKMSKVFGIARAMVLEIVYMNDEAGPWKGEETPEARWTRMQKWVSSQIKQEVES